MNGETNDLSGVAAGGRLPIVIAGGGVAALELALALHDLAPAQTDVTVVAPNHDFIYRPYAVREPFGYAPATQYPVDRILDAAGAAHVVDELAWVDPEAQVLHTAFGSQLPYGALAIAIGAHARPRFAHAITIDDAHLDELMHGLVLDVEEGAVRRLAFVIPARMAWPMPVYDLALMTAARAYEMNVEIEITILTPEDTPLAIFGGRASDTVEALLQASGITTITSAYAEVCGVGEIAIDPGDRQVIADRIVALPELYGPAIRGIAAAKHGFIRVDRFGQVPDSGPVFAAGDAVDFAVKHGGISSQQADVAARSIAVLAGAEIEREQFQPVLRGLLLTGAAPRYLSARITGGHGFASEISDSPPWSPVGKIAAKHLGPCLASLDAGAAASR
jgi:sulfide:quinone oxidoreductase